MSSLKKSICLVLSVALLLGCQQKKEKRSQRFGRGLRGSTVTNQGAASAQIASASCGSYEMPGKYWGVITNNQGDQVFAQELNILNAPILNQLPAEDQLGNVSSQSGQFTGVRFWGNVGMNAYGQINPATAEIRIEIFDSRACQPRSDGSIRPVMPIDIGANQPGFAGVEGYMNNGTARLTFMDSYGAIILEGQINGSFFAGTISYTTAQTSGQARILGQFQIPTQGFFVPY